MNINEIEGLIVEAIKERRGLFFSSNDESKLKECESVFLKHLEPKSKVLICGEMSLNENAKDVYIFRPMEHGILINEQNLLEITFKMGAESLICHCSSIKLAEKFMELDKRMLGHSFCCTLLNKNKDENMLELLEGIISI
ncbi:hypothetical protein SDC9_172064 [bioreactor metagenome]|uniref:Uncharacterized protein n=1 Tax=bioreactor metagenome TaxID=1076179 RepID=A0A645GF58_9ZZZZ